MEDEKSVGIMGLIQEWAAAHAGDIVVGAAAIALVWFIIEFFKPWIKLLFAKFALSEDIEDATLKTMPYLVSSVVCIALDFQGHWASLTGMELVSPWHIFVGTFINGGAAHLAYYLTRQLQVVKTLKLRWQRFNGVTQEDLDQIRTLRVRPPITEEDIAKHKEEQDEDT